MNIDRSSHASNELGLPRAKPTCSVARRPFDPFCHVWPPSEVRMMAPAPAVGCAKPAAGMELISLTAPADVSVPPESTIAALTRSPGNHAPDKIVPALGPNLT